MAAGCREFTLIRCQNRQIQITLAQYIVFRKREIVILHPNLERERHPIILFLLRPHQFIILVSGRSLLEFGQNANKNANCLNLTLHFYFCLLLIKINAGQNKTCLEITNTSCVRLWLSPSFPLAQIGDLMPAQTSLQLVCNI